MSKKMIQLDPKFMSISKKQKNGKTQKKKESLRKSKITNTGALRKQLLTKIKDFQKKTEETPNKSSDNTRGGVDNFEKEFDKSLSFLQNLSSSKKKSTKKKHHRNTSQHKSTLSTSIPEVKIAMELPKEMMETPTMRLPQSRTTLKNTGGPAYGCLKNGSLPTYREFIRGRPTEEKQQVIQAPRVELNIREKTLEQVKNNFKNNRAKNTNTTTEMNAAAAPSAAAPSAAAPSAAAPSAAAPNAVAPNAVAPSAAAPNAVAPSAAAPSAVAPSAAAPSAVEMEGGGNSEQKTQHRIKTTKYKLGKNKTSKVMSILIKNSDTRKRVSAECRRLKKKSILEVKNYLRKRNLLKTGSDAPPDVLRSMYENAVLTGEVSNDANDTLVHNFYNK